MLKGPALADSAIPTAVSNPEIGCCSPGAKRAAAHP
jgi:hypothetical protein